MVALSFDNYKLMKSIVKVTSPHLGKDFIKVVCSELKNLFSADVVFIAEAINCSPTTKVKILYQTNPLLPDEVGLEGTPCKGVYRGSTINIDKEVSQKFEILKGTNFDSYYGIPIIDSSDTCTGHIAILSENPQVVPKELEEIAMIFAQRVNAEQERIRLESDNRRMIGELYQLSIIDPLTNVYNRRFFEEKCDEVFSQVNRSLLSATLVFIDLDDFKKINDQYGHDIGDFVLKSTADILVAESRVNIDFISRIGGEEFAIISLSRDIDDSSQLCQRLMSATQDFFSDQPYNVTYSVGISAFNEHKENWLQVYELADANMYKSKQGGKNMITC